MTDDELRHRFWVASIDRWVIFLVLTWLTVHQGCPQADGAEPSAALLDAIHQEESEGAADVAPRWDVNGISRGPFQFHELAWIDAMRFLGERWPWTDAHDLRKARLAAAAYMGGWGAHYGRTSDRDYARIFNAGPRGWRKAGSLGYWARVRAEMEGN